MGIGQRVHSLLRRVGFDLVRFDDAHFPECRVARLLRARGVDLVLDVGANSGQYARALRQAGYYGAIVSMEPLSEPFARLSRAAADDPRWTCVQLAVSDGEGAATMHVSANSFSSSLLSMAAVHERAAPKARYVGEEEVMLSTLDALRERFVTAGQRVWLKLDIQGSELPALRAAESLLAEHVEGVEVELSRVGMYTGQALLPEVVAHLSDRGFELQWLEPEFVDPESGEALQLDGVFARRR